jgi:transcriptional regulator with XRE-family HTH domain
VHVTVVAEANPTVARRRLAVYFRKLREQHGVGLDTLADVLGVKYSHASRLDTGARGFQAEDISELARLYDLPDAEQARLLALAEEARRRAWWQQYDLAPSFRTMVGMEQAAVSIGEYAGIVLPGLLQTPDYARAVAGVAPGAVNVPQQRIADAVEVRMRRQRILARERPPTLWFVIDEAALARVGGGAAVMRRQLEHLHAMTNKPEVTIQVVGFEYGLYPGGIHFIILQMPDDLPDVLYTESLQEPEDTADAEKVQEARRRWDILRAVALSPRDSAERILQHIGRLGS